MPEFNLLQDYPKTKRGSLGREVTSKAKRIAKKLDFHYFDGDRKHGFGGYTYDGRWRSVARLAQQRYGLNRNSRVLVDRSDKAFLVYDLMQLIPGITVFGTHPSEYSINHAMDGYGRWALINGVEENQDPRTIEQRARESVMPFLIKSPVYDLPFKDGFFNTVISINNVCACERDKCSRAIQEIMRVSQSHGSNCYIQNDSWTNDNEKEMLMKWSLLCRTFLSTEEWKEFFLKDGYNGDWGFTIIE